MFEYFYNEILRKTIIGFGTLFNAMEIQQEGSVVRIPLAYGPTQKFLARIEQSPDLNKPMAITLPRMSFEFTGLTYDPSRKVTTTQTFVAKDKDDGTEVRKSYMPVPYNMAFELSIYTKLNDDALQIVEQILPYFQPSYNLSIELVDQIKGFNYSQGKTKLIKVYANFYLIVLYLAHYQEPFSSHPYHLKK